jgi:hypothetical protein
MSHTPSTSGSPGRQSRYSSGPFFIDDDRERHVKAFGEQLVDQRTRIEFGLKRPIGAERGPRPLGEQCGEARLDRAAPLAPQRRSGPGARGQ